MSSAKIKVLFYHFQYLYFLETSVQCFTELILTDVLVSLAGDIFINSPLNMMFCFNCALYQIEKILPIPSFLKDLRLVLIFICIP